MKQTIVIIAALMALSSYSGPVYEKYKLRATSDENKKILKEINYTEAEILLFETRAKVDPSALGKIEAFSNEDEDLKVENAKLKFLTDAIKSSKKDDKQKAISVLLEDRVDSAAIDMISRLIIKTAERADIDMIRMAVNRANEARERRMSRWKALVPSEFSK